jgi:hypothetical protein
MNETVPRALRVITGWSEEEMVTPVVPRRRVDSVLDGGREGGFFFHVRILCTYSLQSISTYSTALTAGFRPRSRRCVHEARN